MDEICSETLVTILFPNTSLPQYFLLLLLLFFFFFFFDLKGSEIVISDFAVSFFLVYTIFLTPFLCVPLLCSS